MSTTITYKGNTLATVSNATKTLKTAGKYMEDDVQLTDVSGGTAAISVVDTTDTHGGTIREITALDISDTTAVASDVAQGKYFYTSAGVKTLGTGSGGGSSSVIVTDQSNNTGTTAVVTADEVTTLTTKTIITNGTYAASSDGADGYSSVTVNVSGGGSITQDANGYIILPSS